MGRHPQDRPHAPGRRHAADAWARRSAAWPGSWSCRSSRASAAHRGRAASCPSAARPSARASTRIPSSAAAWPRCSARETGIPFVEAANHFEANAQRDGLVECHGQLRAIAVTLFNVANNIRWLGSGPRCGFYEIKLPDRQPGSSIMPGKVNPVMCESLMQVGRPGDGQRSDDRRLRRGRRAVPAQHHDAGDGRRGAGKRAAAGRRHARPSPSCAWRTWRPTAEACEAARREEPGDGHRPESATSATSGRRRWPKRPSRPARRSASSAARRRSCPRSSSTRPSIPGG